MLSKDDAIKKQSFHIYTDTASARMTMEYCVMHVQTCENPVTVYYNQVAAITSATHLIHKLPLPSDLPLYILLFSLFSSSSVHFRVCCGPWLPIQSFFISSSLWPLYANFLFPISSNSLISIFSFPSWPKS